MIRLENDIDTMLSSNFQMILPWLLRTALAKSPLAAWLHSPGCLSQKSVLLIVILVLETEYCLAGTDLESRICSPTL